MPEYVHVKVKDTGHEGPVLATKVQQNPDAYTETGKPARTRGGDLVPWKHKTTVAKSAAAKKNPSGQQADPEKEKD